MKSAHQTPSQHTSLKAYVRTLVLVWTACASVSLSWNLHQQTLDTLEVARTEARMSYEKDAIYRIWNARHGGVYVPVSEKTPPNPYLEEIERDIRTPWGVTLTRVNPAYMIRQVNEMELKAFGIQSHLTSLKPIRPENAPDPWERAGLKTFQEGAQEVSSQEKMAGETYMRLMRPLRMEQGCLKCHAAQGYKVGDVRGGISVSIPMSPLWALARSHRVTLTFAHGILWALGIAGICIGSTGLRKQIEDRKRAEGRLRKVNLELENKNRQLAEAIERVRGMALETEKAYKELNQIFNTAVDGMCVIDKEFNVLRINRTFSEMSGMEEAYAVEKKCYELFGSELCEKGRCPLKRILAGEEYVEDELDMEWG